MARKRGKQWELEPGRSPCACGSQAAVIRNLGSGERLFRKHDTPAGRTCPEFEWQEAVERTKKLVDLVMGGAR